MAAAINRAEYIKRTVSIERAIELYLPAHNQIKHGRMRCPIHGGEHFNFSVRNGKYKCFVCNAEGDVIDLVCEIFGLDFKSAMQKLNDDFALGLTFDGKDVSNTELSAKIRAAEAEWERKHTENDLKDAIYDFLNDVWCACDKLQMRISPNCELFIFAGKLKKNIEKKMEKEGI